MRLGPKPARHARCLLDSSSTTASLRRTPAPRLLNKARRPIPSGSSRSSSRHISNVSFPSSSAPPLCRAAATATARLPPSSYDDYSHSIRSIPKYISPLPKSLRRLPPRPPSPPPPSLKPDQPSERHQPPQRERPPAPLPSSSLRPKDPAPPPSHGLPKKNYYYRHLFGSEIPRVPCRPINPLSSPSRDPSRSSSSYLSDSPVKWCHERAWTQESLLRAYIPTSNPTQLRSLEEIRNSVNDLIDGAGDALSEMIVELGMDEELFVSWRDVLLSGSVREALEIFRSQKSKASRSEDGKPLWPVWLVEEIMNRSKDYKDVHLALALAVHHLPSLPPRHQASLLERSLALSVRHNMTASVSSVVDLCLSAAPDLSEHSSYQNKLYDADIRAFHNRLLRTLLLFRVRDRSDRLHEPLLRVLQAMYDHSVWIDKDALDELHHSTFQINHSIRELLFMHMERQGTKKQALHVATLLRSASINGKDELAEQCATVLKEMWIGRPEERLEGDEDENERQTRPLSSELEKGRVSMTTAAELKKPDDWVPMRHDPHPIYNRSFHTYLQTLHDQPEEAIRCFNNLHAALSRYPSQTSPKPAPFPQGDAPPYQPLESESSLLIAFNWISLVETLGRSSENALSSDQLLRLLRDSRSNLSRRTRGSTFTALMYIFRRRGEQETVLRLWEQMIGEGIVPTDHALGLLASASKELGTFGKALRTIDEWAYRPAIHELLPDQQEGVDGPNYRTQVYVRLRSDPSAPPRLKVQVSRELLSGLIRCFNLRSIDGSKLVADDFPLSLRIWDAAPARWGAQQDVEALARLIRGAQKTVSDELETVWPEGWSTALDVMEAGMERDESRVDWAKCSVEQFFMPLEVDGESRVPAWDQARMQFEEIVLDNYPELKDAPHPFDELEGDLQALHAANPTSTPASLSSYLSSPSSVPPWNPLSPILSSPYLASFLPPPSPRYAHFSLHHTLFRDYILLLFHHRRTFDIPRTFIWMRHLRLIPTNRCISLAIAVLARAESHRQSPSAINTLSPSPSSSPSGTTPSSSTFSELSDDKKLYVWLRSWLSQHGKSMPPDEEIAQESADVEYKAARREKWMAHRRESAAVWRKEKEWELARQARIKERRSEVVVVKSEGLSKERVVKKGLGLKEKEVVEVVEMDREVYSKGEVWKRQRAREVLKEREGMLGSKVDEYDDREARKMGLLVAG